MPREMKESGIEWIGEIPKEWNLAPAKHLIEIKKRIAGKEGYTVLSITQSGIKPKDITSGEGQLAESYANYQFIHPGEFGMNHMDLLTGWIDISNYFGVVSPDYRVFATRHSQIEKRYLLYLYQMCYKNKIFYSLGQGAALMGRWRLPATNMMNMKLPVPPIDEQTIIADYLDHKCTQIDSLVSNIEAQIAKLNEYRKALTTQAVTKGLDPNAEMKDSGIEWIGEIPKGWEVSRIKYKVDLLDEYRIPVNAENRINDVEELFPYFGASGQIDWINGYTIDDDILLIGEDGANLLLRNLPLIYRSSGKAWINNHAHILKGKSGMSDSYLFYMLESGDYTTYVSGSAQPKLTQTNLLNFRIPVPPFTEQTAIAFYLDDKSSRIDSITSAYKKQLQELSEYKKSLIFDYVTGKKVIPDSWQKELNNEQ